MRLEKKATLVATITATLLMIIKMSVAIFSGSVAVLASAIDSMLDLSISLFNYFALHNSEKNPDEEFNYGRTKLEPLAAVVEGTIISLSALFILYESLIKVIHPREIQYMSETVIVMIISIMITLALVLFLNYVARRTNNLVIKADALHYKTDLFSNAAVLIALGIVYLTQEQVVDSIIGVGIAVYMIYSVVPILKEGINMLLDKALPKEDQERITALIHADPEITDFHDLKTRESGGHIFISMHAVLNVSISLYDAHLISDKLEMRLKALFDDKKVHILIHLDPYDDSVINEEEDSF
jgi:cation diffusion facilitator family transporter